MERTSIIKISMSQKKEKYQRLYQKLNEYQSLGLDAINALEKILEIKTIEKKEYLTELYEEKRKIGFVLEGIIRVYHLTSDGLEFNKNFFIKDELFMTTLSNTKDTSVFIQSVKECTVIIFDYDEYIKLSHTHQVLEQTLNKIFLRYLDKKQEREIDLLALDAKSRYIKFIKNNPYLSEKLEQFHVASYLGVTPTQLSRIKKVVKNQHL